MPGLQELGLGGCKALTDRTPLAGLTGLRTLDLGDCEELIDLTPLAGLVDHAGLTGLTVKYRHVHWYREDWNLEDLQEASE